MPRGRVTENHEHDHAFDVDNAGNGATTEDDTGHIHEIVAFNVQPAGEDNHTHEIKDQPLS